MSFLKRSVVLGAVLTTLALLAPAAGTAATATVTGTVTGSVLSASTAAVPSFSDNLDLGDQTQTYTVPMTVQDTRGTGAGWHLTITSTQFSTGGGTPNLLATNASSLTGVTAVCASGTCTAVSNSTGYPVAVPAGSGPPTAVNFVSDAANNGMGKFTVTPTVGVFVPQNSFAGTYTSTLTLAIVSGP
jgi:hypothetical protein